MSDTKDGIVKTARWIGRLDTLLVVCLLAIPVAAALSHLVPVCPDPSLHEPGLVVCPHYTPEQMDAEPLVPVHREVKGKVL